MYFDLTTTIMILNKLSLEGNDLLLSDVMSNMTGVKSFRKPALAKEDGVDSSSVSGETSTGLLLNCCLSGGVSLEAWHIRNWKEASSGITVRVVGTSCSSEPGRELGSRE